MTPPPTDDPFAWVHDTLLGGFWALVAVGSSLVGLGAALGAGAVLVARVAGHG